jgi:hypothetical protein
MSLILKAIEEPSCWFDVDDARWWFFCMNAGKAETISACLNQPDHLQPPETPVNGAA